MALGANIHETDGGSVTVGLPKGFTYFVRDGDMIKIGSSMRPTERIGSLQTGSSRPLEILAVVPIEIADEFKTHQLFAHLRERGEWFRADQELLYFIERAKQDAENAPKSIARPKAVKSLPPPMSVFELMRRPLYKLREGRRASDPIAHACHNLIEMSKNLEWAESDEQKANLKKSIGREAQRLERLRSAA